MSFQELLNICGWLFIGEIGLFTASGYLVRWAERRAEKTRKDGE